jgi:hypothetical protein
MCHPQVIKSRQLMKHDGGNTLKYQDNCEGLRISPLRGYPETLLGKKVDLLDS